MKIDHEVRRLARVLDVSPRKVQRALDNLIGKGLITVTPVISVRTAADGPEPTAEAD